MTNTFIVLVNSRLSGADLGGGCRGCAPPSPEMTCGFLTQLVFCKKKKTMWFIGVEVEQETSAPPSKKILDPPLTIIAIKFIYNYHEFSQFLGSQFHYRFTVN